MTLLQRDLQERYVYMDKRLPEEYQEVEYIQSSGTQLIVIGNSFSTDYKVEIDVQLTATGGDQILFGCATNSYKFGINAYSSNFKTTTGENSWNNTKSEDSNRHTFIMDKSTTYVDGTSYSSSYVSYTFNFGLGLFSYNREESSSRFPAQMKLFSCKIYDGSIILYDLVPCYRKADDVIGLYDLVNDTFYTNSGSGTFVKGEDQDTPGLRNVTEVHIGNGDSTATKIRPVGGLPAEYQEVEWIGGTNFSNYAEQVYIDSGITTSNNIGAWAEMLHTATRDNVQWFTNTLPDNIVRRGLTTYPSGKWCPQWETWRQTDIAYNTDQFYDIKLNWNNNKKCDIDGTTIYNCTNTTFSSNNTIRIGDISYNGYGWKCKFFKISDGTTLVRDLVPCYRKLDNEVGMYDLVNDVFYTNQGSGTFTKGNDVN